MNARTPVPGGRLKKKRALKSDVDRDDFATRKEAQRFFEKHGGPREDPHGLDGDGEVYLVNEVMARSGYAAQTTYPPDVKYEPRIRDAVAFARAHGHGLWSGCQTDAAGERGHQRPATRDIAASDRRTFCPSQGGCFARHQRAHHVD